MDPLKTHQELFARISLGLWSYLSNGIHARCKLFAWPPAHTLSISWCVRFSFTLAAPPRGAQVCLGWPFPTWFVAREWVSLCGGAESGLWWLYPQPEEKETPTRVAQEVWQSNYKERKDKPRLRSLNKIVVISCCTEHMTKQLRKGKEGMTYNAFIPEIKLQSSKPSLWSSRVAVLTICAAICDVTVKLYISHSSDFRLNSARVISVLFIFLHKQQALLAPKVFSRFICMVVP